MDVDTVKTSVSDSSNSMDMMAMMMQMEKFPEFYEPFYNNTSTTTYQQNELISGGSNSTSIFNVNPNAPPPSLLDPSPSNVHITNNNNNSNTIHQQPMTTIPLQQHHPNEVNLNPSGRFRNNNIPNATSFPYPSSSEKRNSMAGMREMIFRIAVMQPIHIDPESIKPPKRRNVKISKDPQSVAARHRRERISERIRILQRLVPGGTKMDTASMLDEAIHYVKFLKKQVQTLEQAGGVSRSSTLGGVVGFPSVGISNANVSYSSLLMKGCQPANCHMVGSTSKQLFS